MRPPSSAPAPPRSGRPTPGWEHRPRHPRAAAAGPASSRPGHWPWRPPARAARAGLRTVPAPNAAAGGYAGHRPGSAG
ncbi:hypothetical protein G6F61_014981 [Rhizopus arrhizus]|nr:hypothetical protein G6F61_014981 [Rhizopus arrhizus]